MFVNFTNCTKMKFSTLLMIALSFAILSAMIYFTIEDYFNKRKAMKHNKKQNELDKEK